MEMYKVIFFLFLGELPALLLPVQILGPQPCGHCCAVSPHTELQPCL